MNDLTSVFSTLTDSLTGIEDADSATAALPALEEADGKLAEIQGLSETLPAPGKEMSLVTRIRG